MKLFLLVMAGLAVSGAEWTKPAEIVVDDTVCATYRARVDDGGHLVIALTLAT